MSPSLDDDRLRIQPISCGVALTTVLKNKTVDILEKRKKIVGFDALAKVLGLMCLKWSEPIHLRLTELHSNLKSWASRMSPGQSELTAWLGLFNNCLKFWWSLDVKL